MGFNMHFYIIFGTNLLTGGPVPVSVFLPISVFRIKGISNGIQMERNLRKGLSWNKSHPGDLEWKPGTQWGGHEVGGRAQGVGAPPTLMGPSWLPWPTSFTFIYPRTLKTSRSTTKNYFHRRNPLYPRDPILEPSSVLGRRGNQPRRASTSTP